MIMRTWLDPGPRAIWLAILVMAQSTAVLLLAWAIARIARRSPSTRHAVWLVALVGVLIGPAAIVAADRGGWVFPVVRVPSANLDRATSTAPRDETAASTIRPAEADRPTPAREPDDAEPLARESRPASGPAGAVARSSLRISWAGLVMVAWALGTCLMLAGLAWGLAVIARWRAGARPADDPRLDRMAGEVAREFGLRSTPSLRVSDRLSGPVAIGLIHRVILLPAGLAKSMDDDGLRDILVHETAHLARRDPLIGLAQRIAVALFWPHPMIHVLNRELNRAREEICDNHVLRRGGRARYARTLVDLAESIRFGPPSMVSAGLLPARWNLADRVAGLLDERRDLMVRVNRWTMGGLAALMTIVVASFSLLGPARAEVPFAANPPAVDDGPITPREIAGTVVDIDGKPIEGAKVMAWSWVPHATTLTDASGRFRFLPFDRLDTVPNQGAELRVVKEGYASQEFPEVKGGTADLAVTLSSATAFEGFVTAPGGRPAPDVLVRASFPHLNEQGLEVGRYWCETHTDADGHYRLAVSPNTYDFQVRVPGTGVFRRENVPIRANLVQKLDLPLARGVAFRARVKDSVTGEPVPGVRLWHWQHPGLEALSDADGVATFDDMLPGPFSFDVQSPGDVGKINRIRLAGPGPWYSRWWSDQGSTEWTRRQVLDDSSHGGWQRNFDSLDFTLVPNMEPVDVIVERGVVVRGRVLDPDGQPVAGATVAPALTGSGNSLTGDTRFSVSTGPDGRYETLLPAGNGRQYNLMAHDGEYTQWRMWGNGVSEPLQTKPGDVVEDLDLRLTIPAIVRGRVVDEKGQPVAGRDVRASAVDALENRYYDPTTATDADGKYELKFIRPGEHRIQVWPGWFFVDQAKYAPPGSSATVTLEAGQMLERIDLVAPPAPLPGD